MLDLLTAGGRVNITERPARAEEVGRRLRDIEPGMAVRLYRAGEAIGFWESERCTVRDGDLLLVIEPVEREADGG